MSALGSPDLEKRAEGNLALQSDQPGGRSVVPPFSEKFSVDEKLILSHEYFKQAIYDFIREKNITPLSQLTATPSFPTPCVLAQLASKAYEDYKRGETDAQYETRLALPDGWRLLTTASNRRKTNGYFGAAYWHPEHQHVVIAHRGTKLTNWGRKFTDVVSVMFKHLVPQMCSPSTFINKVVKLLRELKKKQRARF